jgi:hypothetical protein
VVGLLDGDPTAAPYSTWLATPTGQRVIVVWPRGFSARFQPDLELISRSNTVVARRGEPIDLNMGWKESGGTVENPYRPSWVNSGCYAPVH